MHPPADARASLESAPDPVAAAPGSDAGALRAAYLQLLKLALCDLVGTTTTSVGAMADGSVAARELRDEGLRLRAAGMDWPLHGLTMVGLRRLDDLQACLESIVADGVAGDVIEAGCWRGGASIFMRATLDSLGEDRGLVVADSFQGFPEGAEEQLTGFDFLAVGLEEVRASFRRLGVGERVEFVPGFFEQSLAPLVGRRWALVRLDADTYEPTRAALHALYPGLTVGGYLVLDDYGSFEGCRRAVDEFRAEYGISEPLEQVDFTCWRWRRTSEKPVRATPLPAPAMPPRAAERAPAGVPTEAEVELRWALREAQQRLAEVEAALQRAESRPWRRLGRRLRAQ
jgi:O-methyltransferase